jgi:hypothetical protein
MNKIVIEDCKITHETDEYVFTSNTRTGEVRYEDKKTGQVTEFVCRKDEHAALVA